MMARVIVWKELREQFSVVAALVALAVGLFVAIAVLSPEGGRGEVSLRTITSPGRLAAIMLSATAGVVVGGALFAGEREAKTLTYLDQLPGSRAAVWRGKVAAGLLLVGGAEAVLAGSAMGAGLLGPASTYPLWAVALGGLAYLSFAWGAVGSVHARTSLAACGQGAAYSLLFLILAFLSSSVGLGLLIQVAGGGGANRGESGVAAAGLSFLGLVAVPLPLSLLLYTAPDRARRDTAPDYRPLPGRLPGVPKAAEPARRDEERAPTLPERWAHSGGKWFGGHKRLFWLVNKQLTLAFVVQAAIAVALGCVLLIDGLSWPLVWPAVGVVVGVLVGVTLWGDEQAGEAARFWGERRLRVRRLFRVKLAVGLANTLLLTLLAAGPVVVSGRFKEGAGSAHGLVSYGFPFLTFLLAPSLTGFCVGQLAGFLFRKAIVAAAVGLLVGGTLVAFWMPSFFSGGLHLWQPLAPLVVIVLTTRSLVWPWATNRLGNRGAVLRLVAGVLATLAVFAGGIGYRVLEVPTTPNANLDRIMSDELPTFDDQQSGRDLRRAISLFAAPNPDKPLEWEALLALMRTKPLGVLEDPNEMFFDYKTRNLAGLRPLLTADLVRGLAATAAGRPEEFLTRLDRVFFAIRITRSRTTLDAMHESVLADRDAAVALAEWLGTPEASARPDLLAAALKLVREHRAQLPDPAEIELAYQVISRHSLEANAQWLPRYLGAGRDSQVAEVEANVVSFFWAVPWERERLQRFVSLGNDPAWVPGGNPVERPDLLRGCVASNVLLPYRYWGPRYNWQFYDSKLLKVMHDANEMMVALALYRQANGGWPYTADHWDQFRATHLPKGAPLDPFARGAPYRYRLAAPGESVRVADRRTLEGGSPEVLPPGAGEFGADEFSALAALAGAATAWPLEPGWELDLPPLATEGHGEGCGALVGGAALGALVAENFDALGQSPPGAFAGGPGGMPGGLGGPSRQSLPLGRAGLNARRIPGAAYLGVPEGALLLWSAGTDGVDDGGRVNALGLIGDSLTPAGTDLIFVLRPPPAKK